MRDHINVFKPALSDNMRVLNDGDIMSQSGTVCTYLLATPEREAADDLYEALKNANKMLDKLSKLIAKAAYEAEELEKGEAPWEQVHELMLNGYLASFEEEFAEALKRAEGKEG